MQQIAFVQVSIDNQPKLEQEGAYIYVLVAIL